jgi:ADP-ribose pyrophosphatase YjhB (NUDIX family)
MKEIDKLAWICIKNNRLLCARSKGKNIYYIPGGKREIGESDEAALTREIKEELSIDLLYPTIKYMETFKAQADGKADGIMVKISCYQANYLGEIKANAEIEEVIWLNYEDKVQCSLATQLIMEWLKAKKMID